MPTPVPQESKEESLKINLDDKTEPPAKPPRRLAKEHLDVDDGFRLKSGRIIS
jgi:hypothetical protein